MKHYKQTIKQRDQDSELSLSLSLSLMIFLLINWNIVSSQMLVMWCLYIYCQRSIHVHCVWHYWLNSFNTYFVQIHLLVLKMSCYTVDDVLNHNYNWKKKEIQKLIKFHITCMWRVLMIISVAGIHFYNGHLSKTWNLLSVDVVQWLFWFT